MKLYTYVFDIDNTICITENSNYHDSEPLSDRIAIITQLHDSGHFIILCTARGMGRSGNNPRVAYELFFELTKNQLEEWGVKYHSLMLGKPAGDFYIDDKGIKDHDFFEIRSFE